MSQSVTSKKRALRTALNTVAYVVRMSEGEVDELLGEASSGI
jgi:hypothetical protein